MIKFISEKDIQKFIANEALTTIEAKRLLNKIELTRLFNYVDESVFVLCNVDTPTGVLLECIDKYLRPITLTLLELNLVQYNSYQTNTGQKKLTTVNSDIATDTGTIQEMLYKDLAILKKRLDVFLCSNLDTFVDYKGCGCGCNSNASKFDLY
jgi:hypothetical protein